MIPLARRWSCALFLSMFAVAPACGDDPASPDPGPGGGGGGGGAGGGGHIEGRHTLRLDLHAEHTDEHGCVGEATKVGRRWGLVADLTATGARVEGWLAVTEVASEQGTPVQATLGSEAVHGAVDGASLTLAPPVELSAPPGHVLRLGALTLERKPDGMIEGTAAGTWVYQEFDHQCELPFTAVVSGEPDQAPPGAFLPGDGALLPFEPIHVLLTEPVATDGLGVNATADGAPIAAALVPGPDARPGFARSLQILPQTAWPEGAALALTLISLTDAAANGGDVQLDGMSIAVAPETNTNLGFEDGLTGWIERGWVPVLPETSDYDENGAPYTVTPPEGGWLARISENSQLIGHVVPPAGATRLKLSIGVIDTELDDLLQQRQGFLIELVAGGERIPLADGGDLQVVYDPTATWTGFGTLDLELPPSAAEGAWIVVQSVGFAPPIHAPDVLLDGLSFE